MAACLSTFLDVHLPISQSDSKKLLFFTSPIRQNLTNNKRFTVSCNAASPRNLSEAPNPRNPSLSDQLKPLSTTTLSTIKDGQFRLLSKPKSTWVNPTKPKRSVLSPEKQKRSVYLYNPKFQEWEWTFAQKLIDCDSTESAFMSVLEQIPHPLTRETALFILVNLKPWQKTQFFFNWLKSQNLFPLDTIFYNIAMKSFRLGRRFELIEELANEMVSNKIELDNITYSTIISAAKRCHMFDKAMEWFERMYRTGLMPDEVTYSAILDVYAKSGKVEEVLSLYERGVASGWKPDPVSFSVLARMFGETGDYDGIIYVLQEMKSLGVMPNLVVYNTLLEAMGKAGKPGLARNLFEEMLQSGLTPNSKTLTALIKIYGKARWAKDAMELWEQMKLNGWPMDIILYNTLLNMCADIGMMEEAERLFENMKRLKHSRPDSWSYTAMLNIYGSGGSVDKAMVLFEEMSELGVGLNVMGCTCLIQCLGRAGRFDDLVKVFNVSIERGVKPDDRLCGCLLSVMSHCDESKDVDKVFACLQQANPKLVVFVKLIEDEETSFETVKKEFKDVVIGIEVAARRPFCNCFIDICRNRNLYKRARELLHLGTFYGLYPDLYNRTAEEWSLDVRTLSVGATCTALEEWMGTLARSVKLKEGLPEMFSAYTGTGTHKFAQGLANAFASHAKTLAAPFRPSEEKGGRFVASREDLVTWVQSRFPSAITA